MASAQVKVMCKDSEKRWELLAPLRHEFRQLAMATIQPRWVTVHRGWMVVN
jgi:hypothetical protein